MFLLSLILSNLALADAQNGYIFDVKTSGGVYHSSQKDGIETSPLFEVNPMLIVGQEDQGQWKVDLAFSTSVRNGSAEIVDADGRISSRYLPKNSKLGVEGSVFPFRYRRDDGYYEISLIEVSAVMKVAEKGGHRVLAMVGINPLTKRAYRNDLGGSYSVSNPIAVGPGYFYNPDVAHVYGAPYYYYDPRANGTYASNGDVFFGGGYMTRSEYMHYDTSEYSARIPVSIEYQYQTNDKHIQVYAKAYYTLRMGADSLERVREYTDLYEGFVSYSNVLWNSCEDSYGNAYLCDPIRVTHAGGGYIADYHTTRESLDSRGFIAHSVGAQGEATYSLYKSKAAEVLLSAEGRVEYDTHVYNAANGLGDVRTATHIKGLLGGIVRF